MYCLLRAQCLTPSKPTRSTNRSPATTSGTDIVTAVRETVGALFWSMESHHDVWMADAKPEPVPTLGPDHELTTDTVRVNRKRIYDLFQKGVTDLSPI